MQVNINKKQGPGGTATYDVSYNPTTPGLYKVHVTYNGIHIPGSVFTVRILEAISYVAISLFYFHHTHSSSCCCFAAGSVVRVRSASSTPPLPPRRRAGGTSSTSSVFSRRRRFT